jgi:hypothetical protein
VRSSFATLPLAICEIARTFFGESLFSFECLIDGTQQAIRSRETGLGFILAGGLFNTLVDATAKDDLTRRDALLDELRTLTHAYPDDAAVREPLSRGLFNTLVDATAKDDLTRRDALLDELRALAHAYADDAGVRDQLAHCLFNTIRDRTALPYLEVLATP